LVPNPPNNRHATQARVLQGDVDLHRVTLDAARAEYARLADINGEAVVAWRRSLRQDLVNMAAEVAAVQVRACAQWAKGWGAPCLGRGRKGVVSLGFNEGG